VHPVRSAPERRYPTGVLVITAATDPDTSQFHLRVRSTSDVTSGRDEVLVTREPAVVLEVVGRWLNEVRDAAVTVRPQRPVTVIRPELELHREDD
jgi:hypothetical protein